MEARDEQASDGHAILLSWDRSENAKVASNGDEVMSVDAGGTRMAKWTGGCLCGAIRYEVNGDPVRVANCHCDDCRKATGSSFATNAFFKEEDVVVLQGSPKSYQHTADSGSTMTKQFCGDCGSQLFGFSSGGAGVKNIKVGTIDDASGIRPQINVFTSKALEFTHLSEDTEHFERGRPR